MGRIGNLKSSTDPAVILLPEFLAAVQKMWKTEDNLILFAPSATGITFAEEHNQKLLDAVTPQWQKQLLATPSPLSEQLLLRTPAKITFANFKPTTKPTTTPATKPVPYIAH